MDFRSRGMQQPSAPTGANSTSSKFRGRGLGKLVERGPIALLFGVTIVIAALTAMLMLAGDGANKAVNKEKYQAVFLANGQVYFGNIKHIGDKSVNLQNIYYLQTNGAEGQEATSSSNVSLVKLGCELHAPYDRMMINSEQVLFWENLQDSSQVVKAIGQYQKDNPKGQTCSTQSQNSTQQAPTSETQPAGGATAPGAGSATTPPAATPPSVTAPRR